MAGKSLGDRMKEYESVTTSVSLTRRIPVIIRIDGRCFHTFSRKLESPWDEMFHECMCKVAMDVCSQCQGARLAYHFSDEISVLLVDYQDVATESYFGYSLQKVLSVTASVCTASFAEACLARRVTWCPPFPNFDCRAFSLPPDEVCNYFIWRQQDCTRNSVSSLARNMFSHKELHGKNSSDAQDMMISRGVNWNDQPVRFKRGISILKRPGAEVSEWVADYGSPIFTQNRTYIDGWVYPEPMFFPDTHKDSNFYTITGLGFTGRKGKTKSKMQEEGV